MSQWQWWNRSSLSGRIADLEERMSDMEASQAQNQQSIDNEAAAVAALGPKLDTIKTEIDALKGAQSKGQALNFAALDSAVASLGVKADADVADAAPAPAPAPSPAPAPTPPAA